MRRVLKILFLSLLLLCGTVVAQEEKDPAASPPQSAEKSTEEAETYANTLRWSTASEVDNFGFNVYRGDSEDGPFVRLTEDPIPGAGTTDAPSRYSYADDTIDPRKAYWYYVESLSMGGEIERFTPVFRAKPKIEDEATEEDEENGDAEEPSGSDG